MPASVLAQSRIDALAVERESRRLDLLAEVARRYLAIVGAQRQQAVADLDIAQRSAPSPVRGSACKPVPRPSRSC